MSLETFMFLPIIRLIHILRIIWNCKTLPKARVILFCTIVWCWGTPSTVVFRGFDAIRFLQNRFMKVIAWTSSWFGHRESTMEPSLWHQTLSGMLGFYSCSQHLLQQTLDPSPSIVHLFRHWNPTTILRTVIITIMTIVYFERRYTYYDTYRH